MKNKVKYKHGLLKKINHWYYNLQCQYCKKKYRKPPKGDYYQLY